ncbi:hypothetical protein D910_03040 [Dendroctonus ponderosae]
MTLYNKLLIYKEIIKHTWRYGIQLWGYTNSTHIKNIQTVQNKALREIANAPWFIRNNDLHRDLGILTDEQAIKGYANKHQARRQLHPNAEARQLLDDQNLYRRLKITKPFELI